MIKINKLKQPFILKQTNMLIPAGLVGDINHNNVKQSHVQIHYLF